MLAEEFGLSRIVITMTLYGRTSLDSEEIAAKYPEMSKGPEVPKYAIINDARYRKWLPPEAWTEVDMDTEPDKVHPRAWGSGPIGTPLRGIKLVRHVTHALWTDDTAMEIARRAGYKDPERVASLLARLGEAPTARTLLKRHAEDEKTVYVTEDDWVGSHASA